MLPAALVTSKAVATCFVFCLTPDTLLIKQVNISVANLVLGGVTEKWIGTHCVRPVLPWTSPTD